MVISLSIPDELYAIYTKHSPANPHKGIVKQLERFKEIGLADHTLVFNREHLKKLSELTQLGFDTPEDLIKALERSLAINVAGVSVPLTDSQRKRLESLANFFHETPVAYATRKVKESIFNVFGS